MNSPGESPLVIVIHITFEKTLVKGQGIETESNPTQSNVPARLRFQNSPMRGIWKKQRKFILARRGCYTSKKSTRPQSTQIGAKPVSTRTRLAKPFSIYAMLKPSNRVARDRRHYRPNRTRLQIIVYRHNFILRACSESGSDTRSSRVSRTEAQCTFTYVRTENVKNPQRMKVKAEIMSVF